MKKKIWISVAAIALILCCAIGGTLAWLKTSTTPVTNTFTVGDINIELKETTTDYKMVPGNKIDKDPKVTVKEGSEACWLFVKVDESANLKEFISYTVDNTVWTALVGEEGVYYREVSATDAENGTIYSILTDNKVKVFDTVTKADLNGLNEATYPTLIFTAYAVQKEHFDTAAAAWEQAQNKN